MEINLDPNDLTLGEAETFEELTGLLVTDLRPGASIPSRALTAIVFIVKRRDDPDFTLEDARAIRFREITPPAAPSPNA